MRCHNRTHSDDGVQLPTCPGCIDCNIKLCMEEAVFAARSLAEGRVALLSQDAVDAMSKHLNWLYPRK